MIMQNKISQYLKLFNALVLGMNGSVLVKGFSAPTASQSFLALQERLEPMNTKNAGMVQKKYVNIDAKKECICR